MDTLKSVFAVVGAVVVAVVTAIAVVKVMGRYGSSITMACRRADHYVSQAIRKVA